MAQAALDRMADQARTTAAITPARLEAFSKLVCEKLDTADVQARKAYLRSVIAQIKVGDGKIRVFNDKTALARDGHRPKHQRSKCSRLCTRLASQSE